MIQQVFNEQTDFKILVDRVPGRRIHDRIAWLDAAAYGFERTNSLNAGADIEILQRAVEEGIPAPDPAAVGRCRVGIEVRVDIAVSGAELEPGIGAAGNRQLKAVRVFFLGGDEGAGIVRVADRPVLVLQPVDRGLTVQKAVEQ